MVKLYSLAAGVFVVMLIASAARADGPDISAQRLLASWHDEDPSMRMVAEMIASAFASGFSWGGDAAGKRAYCAAPDLKGGRIMSAFEEFLRDNPKLPGIHYRLGRVLVSQPGFGPDVAEQAKHEFEQELEVDPTNAGAEYVLGELAKQKEQWEEAIRHFSRAAKLDAGFGDAFVGWGGSLVSLKRFSDAISPLEAAVRLEPGNPAAHYLLAMAYNRTGRKEDGDREFAIQRRLTQNGAAGEPAAEPPAQPN